MIIDPKTGRIAYHSIRFNADGSTSLIQYDFDGRVLYETMRSSVPVFVIRRTWLDILLGTNGV